MNEEPAEITLEEQPPVTEARPGRRRRLALVLGVVAVLAGGVFAALSLADEDNTPEEAVRALLAAAEQGDVLGVLEALEPGERDVLRDPLSDLVDELNRLEVLDLDLRDVSGIELELRDLELTSRPVRDDLAAVNITAGRGRYRLDGSELPLGSFLQELLGDDLDGADSEGEDDISSHDADDALITVRRGGRWYVSLGYTVAESARRDAGVAITRLPEGVTPDGAGSPEEAVRELVDAGTRFDLRRTLELLAPDELGALHDYAGLFLEQAERLASDARSEASVEVPVLELETDRSGRRARVFVREMELRATADGQAVVYEDGCFRMTEDGRPSQEFCQDDDPADVLRENPLFGSLFGSVEPPALSFDHADAAFGIATVEIDGRWYVSPLRTTLESLVETARLFQPEDLQELRRYLSELFQAFTGGFGSSVEASARLGGVQQDPEMTTCLRLAQSQEEVERCFSAFLGDDG